MTSPSRLSSIRERNIYEGDIEAGTGSVGTYPPQLSGRAGSSSSRRGASLVRGEPEIVPADYENGGRHQDSNIIPAETPTTPRQRPQPSRRNVMASLRRRIFEPINQFMHSYVYINTIERISRRLNILNFSHEDIFEASLTTILGTFFSAPAAVIVGALSILTPPIAVIVAVAPLALFGIYISCKSALYVARRSVNRQLNRLYIDNNFSTYNKGSLQKLLKRVWKKPNLQMINQILTIPIAKSILKKSSKIPENIFYIYFPEKETKVNTIHYGSYLTNKLAHWEAYIENSIYKTINKEKISKIDPTLKKIIEIGQKHNRFTNLNPHNPFEHRHPMINNPIDFCDRAIEMLTYKNFKKISYRMRKGIYKQQAEKIFKGKINLVITDLLTDKAIPLHLDIIKRREKIIHAYAARLFARDVAHVCEQAYALKVKMREEVLAHNPNHPFIRPAPYEETPAQTAEPHPRDRHHPSVRREMHARGRERDLIALYHSMQKTQAHDDISIDHSKLPPINLPPLVEEHPPAP